MAFGVVRVTNHHPGYRLDERLVGRLARRVMTLVGKKAELECLFLDDRAMRALNRRFKKRDRSTDVQSFRIEYEDRRRHRVIGQVAISIDAAAANSRRFRTGLQEEVMRYVIHGILHFFGYRDGTAAGRRLMARKEDEFLGALCTNGPLSKVLTPR